MAHATPTVERSIEFIFAHEDGTWRTEICQVDFPADLVASEGEAEWLLRWADEQDLATRKEVYIGVFGYDVEPE